MVNKYIYITVCILYLVLMTGGVYLLIKNRTSNSNHDLSLFSYKEEDSKVNSEENILEENYLGSSKMAIIREEIVDENEEY